MYKERVLMRSITYNYAKQYFEILMDEITDIHEPVCIERDRKRPVIMVDAEDFQSLTETAYLLRTPANAERLKRGLNEFKAGKGIFLDADAIMDAGSTK